MRREPRMHGIPKAWLLLGAKRLSPNQKRKKKEKRDGTCGIKIDQSSSLTEAAALLMLLVVSSMWDAAVSTASDATLLALAARSAI